MRKFLKLKSVLALVIAALFACVLAIAPLGSLGQAHAASAPSLGPAAAFAVLGAQTVTNTGATVLTGDLGVSPGTSCTGFPTPCTGGPGIVNGTIHAGDAVAATAEASAHTAYTNAAGQACNTVETGVDLGGLTLTPGVYCFASSAFLTLGNLTLSGKGVYIFQIGTTLITASNVQVLLINGATAANVFWQVGSSATLGTGTSFAGSILAEISITATTGVTSNCGLYALTGAVTLDTNTIGTCSGGSCPGINAQASATGPLWVCPAQKTVIAGAPGSENYTPNTLACTRPVGKSCSITIRNSTNVTQRVTLNGAVAYYMKPGGIRQISYSQAGTYTYGLSSDASASLTVTVS